MPEHWLDTNDIPWVSLNDSKWLAEHDYISDTAYRINSLGLQNSSARLLPARAVVFTRDATIGKAAIATRPMAVSQHLIAWLCGPRVLPEYLLRVFNALEPSLERYTFGATIKTIGLDDVRELSMPLPPLEEQSRIVQELDVRLPKIDLLIDKEEQVLRLLAEKRQALIDQTVTSGASAQHELRPTGLSWVPEVPAKWRLLQLKHLGAIRSGIALGRTIHGELSEVRPYLRVANVQNGFLKLTEVSTIEVTRREAARFTLQVGDVLMNEGGDNDKLGRGYVWEGQVPGCLHQNHVFAVRLKRGVDPYWVNFATQASYLRDYFLSRAKQSTNLASISAASLGGAPIALPPQEEVAVLVQFLQENVSRIQKASTLVQESVGRLREYRQALITAAVTGQLDLTQEAA